mmetsp:Transcript_32077/g.75639  ORF Transcript_32077/g.75639 Transcript_32077/m.75639 type:complete len:81 (-) Transcript_32077:262-504(-)
MPPIENHFQPSNHTHPTNEMDFEGSSRRRTKSLASKEKFDKFGKHSTRHLRIREETVSNSIEVRGSEPAGGKKSKARKSR